MNIILNGACGRMGRAVRERIADGYGGARLAAGIDPSADENEAGMYGALDEFEGDADVIIDFSHHTCTAELTEYAVERGLPCVIATTGHTEEERRIINEAAKKTAVFLSANMSLGVAVTAKLVKLASSLLPEAEIEIVETHHDKKLDAPSGTALMLADAARTSLPNAELVYGRHGQKKRTKTEIGIHSLRLGGVIGEHEVIISSGDEIITLKHTAQSRTLFADGALAAAEFLVGKPAGIYDMSSLVGE